MDLNRLEKATNNVSHILNLCFNHDDSKSTLIVYDDECELSKILIKAYQNILPSAQYIHFYQSTPEIILSAFTQLNKKALVVLIQSSNFRLNAFRIRVELFKQELKVIEHPRLNRMIHNQVDYYIESLSYDSNYYRMTGQSLKQKIDQSTGCRIINTDPQCQLTYKSKFESAKLNIGDYSSMKNIGGQFPIGEVFTEALDLTAVNGKASIFAFGDTLFQVNQPKTPILITIDRGQIIRCENSTDEFEKVLDHIRKDEGVVYIRELGFGLNKAFTKDQWVTDIGTYERMCGIHLSLGAKHDSYAKPQFKRGVGKHHVDVFLDAHQVILENESGTEIVYKDSQWCV